MYCSFHKRDYIQRKLSLKWVSQNDRRRKHVLCLEDVFCVLICITWHKKKSRARQNELVPFFVPFWRNSERRQQKEGWGGDRKSSAPDICPTIHFPFASKPAYSHVHRDEHAISETTAINRAASVNLGSASTDLHPDPERRSGKTVCRTLGTCQCQSYKSPEPAASKLSVGGSEPRPRLPSGLNSGLSDSFLFVLLIGERGGGCSFLFFPRCYLKKALADIKYVCVFLSRCNSVPEV